MARVNFSAHGGPEPFMRGDNRFSPSRENLNMLFKKSHDRRPRLAHPQGQRIAIPCTVRDGQHPDSRVSRSTDRGKTSVPRVKNQNFQPRDDRLRKNAF